ncbi:MAG: (d)CMP kinase, partial [Alphaproteobacteria bacterium]|nr:(d)CMP kinase [Alphaproteobacteria bacterium]
MIIAIDGPAAAGKGTLARRLAEHFNLALLDTGSLYRAVGAKVLRGGQNPADAAAAAAAARTLSQADIEAKELREERVGEAASVVAAQP